MNWAPWYANLTVAQVEVIRKLQERAKLRNCCTHWEEPRNERCCECDTLHDVDDPWPYGPCLPETRRNND